MRCLFLGDIVGLNAVKELVSKLSIIRKNLNLDFVIANAENSFNGFGITTEIADTLLKYGVDVLTTGDHIWNQKDIFKYIGNQPRLLRPMNLINRKDGVGFNKYRIADKYDVVVANMLGQVFVENDTTKKISSPFNSVENIFKKFVLKRNFDAVKSSLLPDENGNLVLPEPVDAIIIDFHAEATSEKMTFTHFVDGKVSAVIGTHTHIPTADTCIFNNGTGFQSDAGMCGDYDSSIGMTFDTSLNLFTVRNPEIRLTVADKSISLCGVVIDINDNTGLTDKIEPFRISDRLSNTHNF